MEGLFRIKLVCMNILYRKVYKIIRFFLGGCFQTLNINFDCLGIMLYGHYKLVFGKRRFLIKLGNWLEQLDGILNILDCFRHIWKIFVSF